MQDTVTGHMETVRPVDVPRLKQEGRCVIQVGEIVHINGGTFRVQSIGKKMLLLEGVPGTLNEQAD